MALTQDVVLMFLMSRGGKVKNTELLSAFTQHISSRDPGERRRNRDLFKSFINRVAVVKRVEGVKYVVVKKKYQEMINEGMSSIASSSSPPPPPPPPSSSSSSCTTLQSSFSKSESHSITTSDVLNNNSWIPASPPDYVDNSKALLTKVQSSPGCDAVIPSVTTSNQEESLTAQVLINIANHTTQNKTGAVFAVLAIRSPPCSQSENTNVSHRTSAETGRSRSYLDHEPDLNRSPTIKRRQSVATHSPARKRENKVGETDFGAKGLSVIRLEPPEHQWLVKSATGHWSQLYRLLLQDVHLADKRNFISGFTALHWAAKHGNSKMLRRILDIGKDVDVNVKSHDGYTPLHVAAIHSHEKVLNLLVREYGANCNIRDNSGKKAYQYLHKDLSSEMRQLLGDPAGSCQVVGRADSEEQHFPNLSKNLNTFSKLFQASVGRRKKSRHRSSI